MALVSNLGMGVQSFAPERQASQTIFTPEELRDLAQRTQAAYANSAANYATDRAITPESSAYTQWLSNTGDNVYRQMNAQANALATPNTLQQQAYTAQQGGGFTGGLMANAPAYSQPFGNTITGMPSADMSPWSSLFGSPTYGGGFGSTTPQASGSGQAWGGAFTTKNPWSLG